MCNLSFRPFSADDIPFLAPIQKAAFDEDSLLHLGRPGGPEGYDDGSFLRTWGLHPDATAHVIELAGQAVGCAILFLHPQANEGFLGCLFLSTKTRGQGLGSRVWKEIEDMYPSIRCWRTETPAFSHRNHHFYINKCGFHAVSISNPKNFAEAQFQLEKRL